MTDDPVFVVKSMPSAGLVEDGSVAKLFFESEDGRKVILQFRIPELERFAVRAHQLSVIHRIEKAAKSGHLEVHGVGVAAVTAQPGIGGTSVMLIVRTPQREVVPYSLALDQAHELQAELAETIAEAEHDAGLARQ